MHILGDFAIKIKKEESILVRLKSEKYTNPSLNSKKDRKIIEYFLTVCNFVLISKIQKVIIFLECPFTY